ncbi:MAG: glycosyltransferase family 2 protein [Methyloceanibacter sp.]|uniref:glycosyltransferase family 2 protein n=1 Tax=Methyloceanibacter sp. TaxID=1965321 RepID=UPI003D6D6A26
MYKGARIGVVIPALDEERAIGRVIADIPEWVDQVIVADNGSSDRTAEIAERAGARIVREHERGYGAACQAGIGVLDAADIVVFLDGDYSDCPAEMAALVEPIAERRADFVVGSRVAGKAQRGALTPQQRFGNWLACLLMRRLWGVAYSDLGPFRAIRRDSLDGLKMVDRKYGWTVEMQVKAAKAGLKCLEVPVSYRPRIGTSKISGTLRGSFKAAIGILGVIARSALNTD